MRNQNLIVGCSEISIIVIVKHVQYIGIIRAFCLPVALVKFFSTQQYKKNCWIVVCQGGISAQTDTMMCKSFLALVTTKVRVFLITVVTEFVDLTDMKYFARILFSGSLVQQLDMTNSLSVRTLILLLEVGCLNEIGENL